MLKIVSKKISGTRHKTLYKNDWLELKEISNPDDGVDSYIYSHESRCDGKIISMLPFRKTDNDYQFLLRKELTPCWGEKVVIASITGGYEKKHGIEGTAVLEMMEEAGYEITESDLINLGTCRGTKSTDTMYYLFSVDLTGIKKTGDAKGDGSKLEAKAECVWKDDIEGEDPLTYVSYVRLLRKDIIS